METVMAKLDIEIFVDCPGCDYLIDILNEKETDGCNHNDDGDVMNQTFPDGNWMDAHREFSVEDVTCTKCKAKFNIKGLEW